MTDTSGSPAACASIQVEGINKAVSATDAGEYWRLLAPGKTYRVRAVSSDGSASSAWKDITLEDGLGGREAERVDFVLDGGAPEGGVPAHRAWSCGAVRARTEPLLKGPKGAKETTTTTEGEEEGQSSAAAVKAKWLVVVLAVVMLG